MTAWVQIEATLEGILERRWYTNHGPLACAIEARAAAAFGARHAVIVTNPTIGLIMIADGLGWTGGVLLSALAPRRWAQALRWAGLEPVFCDVDPDGFGVTARDASERLGPGVSGVLGGARDAGLREFACGRGLPFCTKGAGLGGAAAFVVLPGWGDDAGVGCVLTEDDGLAARLRNIRSSYGAGPAVPVVRTANGRVSEAQAGMALLALEDSDVRGAQFEAYRAGLGGRPVLSIGEELAVVLEGVAARDRAVAALAGGRGLTLDEGAVDCPVAAGVAARAVVLPQGRSVDVGGVCALVMGLG